MVFVVAATVALWATAGFHILKTLFFGGNGNGK
jgi:hypothetical protein